MIETKHIIAELSVQEKIFLYNALYEDLASKGIDGDTELAHVNKAEMEALRAMGGSGTINPNTGLIQFGGGSPPPPPPTSQTVSQTSEFPEELKPYITDVLGKAQAIQEKREQEGYRPYEGPQIAEFTPEQQQAFTGISGLVGEGGKYFDPATRLAAASAIAPRAGEVQQYMSPYMQNVVDIQQREAQRQADVAAQQLGAQAVSAGGFGGSRQAILEAEQQRNLQTQLGDIQARGLTAAYEDAQARIAAQRQRELAASGQFAQLGQIAPQQALKELTALEAVGAQQQALSQRGLDIAKSQFEAEQTFPERTLQQYQSVIRGFPLDPSFTRTSQKTTPAPSYLQQAAGLGGLGLGVASAFGGFKAKGGLVSRMGGGQVDQNSGLGSLVVKRQSGKLVDLSIQELEEIIKNFRIPGSERAKASRILMEKRKGEPDSSSSATVASTPLTTPPDKQDIKTAPKPTSTPPLSSTPSEPAFGTLASLRQTPKSDEYFAKATEILGKREKRILDKMDDPSSKMEYLASILSGIAGGTPGAGFGQLASEVAPQALAGAKELRKEQEALKEKAEETSLKVGELGAKQEEKQKKLEASLYKILTKDTLDAKDRATILAKEGEIIQLITDSKDPAFIYKMMTHRFASDAVKAAAKTRYDKIKTDDKPSNKPNTVTIKPLR